MSINKCVIITTINPPTEAIKKFMQFPDYDVIIVGDKKTPDSYKDEDCIFLDVKTQKELFPVLSELIPYNHYGRKNLGYLYAIQQDYKVIYETDDDNIPYDDFDSILDFSDNDTSVITENDSPWINIFKYFTNNAHIWPRGYPLSLIKTEPNFSFEENSSIRPSIINGLVEQDPDVDAIFRLACNHTVSWEKNKKVIISNENMCAFNTQNTFWLNKDLFMSMLLPCSVTFRYCDILKGIISNVMLKKNDCYMAYSSPNVIQLRNEHDLIDDFRLEYDMYLSNENIVDYVYDLNDGEDNKQTLRTIYNNLLDHKVITELDIQILEKWLEYF